MEDKIMTEMLTPKELSKEFFGGKVSYWKILTMAKKGVLPHTRIGNRIFFRRSTVLNWILQQENNSKVS